MRVQVSDPGVGFEPRAARPAARRGGWLGPRADRDHGRELGRRARGADARLVRARAAATPSEAAATSRFSNRTRVMPVSGTTSSRSVTAAISGMPRPPWPSGLATCAAAVGKQPPQSRTSTQNALSRRLDAQQDARARRTGRPCSIAFAIASVVASRRSQVVVAVQAQLSRRTSRTRARACGAPSGAAGSHDSRFMPFGVFPLTDRATPGNRVRSRAGACGSRAGGGPAASTTAVSAAPTTRTVSVLVASAIGPAAR